MSDLPNTQVVGQNAVPTTEQLQQYGNNDVYKEQLDSQIRTYNKYRKVARDGNCFYRSYIYSLLETLVKENSLDTWNDLQNRVQNGYTVACTFHPKVALEDFFESFNDLLCKVWGMYVTVNIMYLFLFITIAIQLLFTENKQTGEELAAEFNNDETSMKFVIPFISRLLCSVYIRTHADEFMPYLPEDITIEKFVLSEVRQNFVFITIYMCSTLYEIYTQVEALNVDADHLQILALTRQCNRSARIVHLRESRYDKNVDQTRCYELVMPSDLVPGATLQFIPGHYEVLYY